MAFLVLNCCNYCEWPLNCELRVGITLFYSPQHLGAWNNVSGMADMQHVVSEGMNEYIAHRIVTFFPYLIMLGKEPIT